MSQSSDINDFILILYNDVEFAFEQYSKDNSDHWRRGIIRSISSTIEGTLWLMKRHALDEHFLREKLTLVEQQILREETYDVDSNGQVTIRPKFVNTLENIKFVFKLYDRISGFPIAVKFDNKGWECVRHLVGARNRIVHPKSLLDLSITEEDIKIAIVGFNWFKDNITVLSDKVTSYVYEKKEEERLRLKNLPTAYWYDDYKLFEESNVNEEQEQSVHKDYTSPILKPRRRGKRK